MNALIRAKKIHEIYGGKIFAIGKISGNPAYEKWIMRICIGEVIYMRQLMIFSIGKPSRYIRI